MPLRKGLPEGFMKSLLINTMRLKPRKSCVHQGDCVVEDRSSLCAVRAQLGLDRADSTG